MLVDNGELNFNKTSNAIKKRFMVDVCDEFFRAWQRIFWLCEFYESKIDPYVGMTLLPPRG